MTEWAAADFTEAPSADTKEIERFVGTVFKHCDRAGLVALRTFRDDADEPWRADLWRFHALGNGVAPAAADLATAAAGAVEPVVFCPPVATFAPDENDQVKADEDHVHECPTIAVECDKNAVPARMQLEQLLGPVTVVMASGGIDVEGNPKHHLHWRLKRPARTPEEQASLKMARQLACRLVGADDSAPPLCHPLRWPGSWHRKRIPIMTRIVDGDPEAEIELSVALEALRAAVPEPERKPKTKSTDGHPRGVDDDLIADLASALGVIPNDGETSRETWNQMGGTIHNATGGRGFELFLTWSEKSPKHHNYETVVARWDHFDDHPYTERGAGSIFHEAKQADPNWLSPSAQRRIEMEKTPELNGAALREIFRQPQFKVWGAANFLAQKPPPREWLLGTTFCRTFLSSINAAGGGAKTSVRIVQGLAMATKQPLTGEKVYQRCRVLLVSLEDDEDELRRRVLAAMMHHKIKLEDIDGYLFVCAPKGLRLMIMGDEGQPVRAQLYHELRREIIANKIDVVILDPFVKTHTLQENDNSALDKVAELLAEMAIEFKIAIDCPHHVRKGVITPGDADAGRGAGSLRDGARLVYTLCPMSPQDANAFNITEEQRRRYIRMDRAKVNIAPPAERATWFRLVSITIGNGNETYPEGDHVQAIERWQPPELKEVLTAEVIEAIMKDIDAGREGGWFYSAHHKAGENSAWPVVTKHCPEFTEGDARRLINEWVKKGFLLEFEYYSPARKNRLRLGSNPNQRPPAYSIEPIGKPGLEGRVESV